MDELGTLLKAARNLDKDALATIFDQYSPVLYKFISRLVHNPVLSDQIVADVFVRLVEELSAGKGPRTSIRSYLYKIAYQLVVAHFHERHPNSPMEVSIRIHEKDKSLPQTQIDEQGMMEALISTINAELSDDQRIVIILRFLEEFNLKEIAEIIGKDVNNVKVIQTRGIARLKKAMGMQIDAE